MRSLFLAALALLTACPPTSPNVSIAPAAPTTLDDLTVTVTPAVPAATFQWAADGLVVQDLITAQVPAGRTTKGEVWSVTVSEGGRERASTQVIIVNAAPTATVSLPPRGTTGQDLVATVDGSDADGDPITYAYTWTIDGERATETSATLPGTAAERGSTVEIEVVPTDGENAGEPVTASTVMDNGIPSVASAFIQPEVPLEADTVRCVGRGWSDPDGDSADYRVRWFVNGVDAGPDDELTGAAFDRGDEITCRLTPWDGSIEGEPVESDPVTVGNTPPVAGSLLFSPASPKVNDALSATPDDLTDADGDAITLSWQWSTDGTDLRIDRDSITVETALAHSTLRVVATPSDGNLDGEPVVGTVEIANSPPVIEGASFSGFTEGELRNGSKPSITRVAATDADLDEYTLAYEWQSNGTVVSTSAACSACEVERGDVVTVTVTASDEYSGVGTKTWTWTVQNSPPSSFSVEADSASGKLGGEVFCDVVADATDADGDSVTYSATWEVNGSAWTGSTETTTHTDDTIPSEGIRLDDTVKCTMEADDGMDTTTATSASKKFTECVAIPSFMGSATPVSLSERSGFCFYLTQKRQTCDATCASLGGGNHAAAAATALGTRCSGPRSGEPAYDFFTGDNEGGWSTSYTGTSSARSLGHGFDGGLAYGACGTGTSAIGAWPGESNSDSKRSLVCACF